MTELDQWLERLGLGKYAQTFVQSSVDFDVLAELTEDDLKELGLTLGDRRRLQRAIREFTRDDKYEAGAEAERRQLTVMFCDLVGSTALSEKLDAEDLREIIALFRQCVARSVAKFQGFIAKYMGDGVLVYFGYPQAYENDAEKALQAALELTGAVGQLEIRDIKLQVRIGIATGMVVVGDLIGAGEAQEHGVVGKTPNLAARLQGIAAADTIVIADTTKQLVKELFDCQDLGFIELKGFSKPVHVWQVLRERAIASRFEALHAASSLIPLIGREEELELLLRRWEKAKTGEGQVVLLSGEAGIGKSRIIASLGKRIAEEGHVRLLYSCSPHHALSALHPVIGQLTHAACIDADDPLELKRNKLETLLVRNLESADDVMLIAQLLGLAAQDDAAITPQKWKERMFEALLRQLEGFARHSAILLLFEDAHWSDPTSLEFLSLVVNRISGWPVLLIVSHRQEFQHPWSGQSHVTAISLNRFGRPQSEELVANVVNGRTLPQLVLQHILDHADGIPLFIEELTKAVLESGLLREEHGNYALAGPLPKLEIPITLQGSLLARLDRLPRVKEVAQIGSAIGREFSFRLLAAVLPLDDETLAQALGRLVETELVLQRGAPPDANYSFKHALVQDAAYATLLRGRRQQIHASIARALEECFAEIVDKQPELLAHHCIEADLIPKAIDYLERAGRKAASQSANREAIVHLEKALELLARAPETPLRAERELRLLMSLGPALVSTRPTAAPEVEHVFSRAHRLARQIGRAAELFPAVWGSWLFAYNSGDLSAARKFSDELFDIAQAEDNSDFLLQAHHAVWPVDAAEARLGSARRHIDAGLQLYRPDRHGQHALVYGGHDPAVCGYTLDAQILAMQGHLDRAVARSESALALARDLSHPPSLIQALAFAADVHVLRRSPRRVAELAQTLLPVASEYGSAVSVANAAMLQAWATIMDGDLDRGSRDLRSALDAWRKTGSKFHKPYRLGRAAGALTQAGLIDDALGLVTDALTSIEPAKEYWFEAELHRLKGEIVLAGSAGSRVDAENLFRLACSIAGKQETRLFELRAVLSLARLLERDGRGDEALDRLAAGHSWFTEALDTPDLADARLMLERLRAASSGRSLTLS